MLVEVFTYALLLMRITVRAAWASRTVNTGGETVASIIESTQQALMYLKWIRWLK